MMNWIVKAAISRLRTLARAPDNERRLSELLFAYSQVNLASSKRLPWDDLVLDRTNRAWHMVITLAKLLLGGRFQTADAGQHHGLALVFDVGKLFERYVGKLIVRALRGQDVRVCLQRPRDHLLDVLNEDERGEKSETDRLLARPTDFGDSDQARSAAGCWSNWKRAAITAHDGMVRPDHPALLAALERVQSASSLAKLLRNPLGFTWSYALGIRAPESAEEALVLDPRQSGILLHETLDHAVRLLEGQGSLASARSDQIVAVIGQAATIVAEKWQAEQAVPPLVVWRRTVDDARQTALNALQHPEPAFGGQKCYTEVPFGGQEAKSDGALPWDPARPVEIADTGFQIWGYIDRLDLSGDGAQARVLDYKGGKLPKEHVVLQGGKELQRCLYAYAVKALLGDGIEIDAALLYPRDTEARHLEEPAAVLDDLARHLRAARASLLAGRAVIGPDNGGEYDDLSFALPANAGNGYCLRKLEPAREALGDAALVWEAT